MPITRLAAIFADAAPPQKAVFLLMAIALLSTPAVAFAAASRSAVWEQSLDHLRVIGPALGLLTGSLNSFHMADTILRLPIDVTAKDLAPGIFEVSSLIALGASIGVSAQLMLSILQLVKRPREAPHGAELPERT